MCLITEQKEAIILTEDLIVYKLFLVDENGKLSAIYQDFIYERNRLYKTTLTFCEGNKNPCFDTEAAMYLESNYVSWYERPLRDNGLIAVIEGFHSAETSRRLRDGYDTIKCLIPAGSEVFYDKTGLIVSNQIMVL